MKILEALCHFITSKIYRTKDQWDSEHRIFMILVIIAILFSTEARMELPPPRNSTRSSLSHEC